jgi:hypothetical protein
MTSAATNAQHGSLAVVADPHVYATLDAIGFVGSKHANYHCGTFQTDRLLDISMSMLISLPGMRCRWRSPITAMLLDRVIQLVSDIPPCFEIAVSTPSDDLSCNECPARKSGGCCRSSCLRNSGCNRAGGPFKPGFGLSGAVLQVDRVFLSLFHVFGSTISTLSQRVSRLQETQGPSTPQIIASR